jgi:hypothetical protein
MKRMDRAVTASGAVEAAQEICLSRLLGPSYCISLVSRPDRRAFCTRQFATERAEVTVFDAIVPADAGGFPSRGTRGCYLSHLRVLEVGLEACQQTGADHLTIFEDDVLLPSGFAGVVERVMPRLEGLPWSFFYWGTQNGPAATPVPGHEPIVEIAPEQTVIGKQAYTVRAEVVPALVQFLRECGERPSPGYSDGMFHDFRMIHRLPAHTHTLQPARQGSFASNLTPARLGWARQPLRIIKRCVQLWTR